MSLSLILFLSILLTIAPLPRFSKYNKWFYRWYIQSRHWKKKRQQRLEIDGYRCKNCGDTNNLECHHKTYKRLGNESVKFDLVILCRNCHKKEHKK